MRRVTAAVLAFALATGCRATPLTALTDNERADFGDVAVAVVRGADGSIGRPTTGWAAGLGVGTARGAAAIVGFAAVGASLFASGSDVKGRNAEGFLAVLIVFGAAVGAAVGAAYAPVSMVMGAATAPSAEELAPAEAAIVPIVEDPANADVMAACFIERARELSVSEFVDLDDATTVVELRVVKVSSGSTIDWFSLDAPFGIRVRAMARVLHRPTSRVVWQAVRETATPADKSHDRTYAQWGADGGAALRTEMDAALRRLGRSFAHTVFVQQPGDGNPEEVVECR